MSQDADERQSILDKIRAERAHKKLVPGEAVVPVITGAAARNLALAMRARERANDKAVSRALTKVAR